MLKAKEKHMQKKLSKTSRIISYMRKRPKATPKEIADALGITPAMVYQVRHKRNTIL